MQRVSDSFVSSFDLVVLNLLGKNQKKIRLCKDIRKDSKRRLLAANENGEREKVLLFNSLSGGKRNTKCMRKKKKTSVRVSATMA